MAYVNPIKTTIIILKLFIFIYTNLSHFYKLFLVHNLLLNLAYKIYNNIINNE